MDTRDRIEGVLKSYGLAAIMPFMVNGEEFTLQSLADQLYAIVVDDIEKEYERGYDDAYKVYR